ncbi:MAG: RNA-binding S4 domain-containing protein [Bacillota bacterium]|nr:RNA-binding S4 domain-containing protein [Bacillota bacterium]
MRIDKYLKVARIIKRRTVAKEACDGGRVSINDKVAKAGDEVRVGDLIDVRMGSGSVRVRVLSISEHVSKDGAKELYEVV